MKKLFILFMLAGLAMASCSKEGPAGADGKDGKDGQDGNANVHSFEVTVYTGDWQAVTGGFNAVKNISAITQSVIDNGTVLVYIKDAVHDTYYALPYGNITFAYGLNSVAFFSFNANAPSVDVIFKIVIIDGTPPSSVNLQDYDNLMNYYNLLNNQ